jgi:hypothetical protein
MKVECINTEANLNVSPEQVTAAVEHRGEKLTSALRRRLMSENGNIKFCGGAVESTSSLC